MPVVRLKLDQPQEPDQTALPSILRTATGTVMLEIQGQINVGSEPLLRTELDASVPAASSTPSQGTDRTSTLIGNVDLTRVDEAGSPVTLSVGGKQLLRGNIVKLPVPLAIMDVSDAGGQEVSIVDIITHKVVFSKRPEPMLE